MKADHLSDTPSTKTKVVENQHFVPKFYLRRFTNQSGLLERLDIGSGEILSVPRPPSSECVIPFFYGQFTGQLDEASQKIEKYWQDIESLIAPKIDGVEKNITEHKRLNEEELIILAVLGSMLWIRTPHLRETINKNVERFEKELEERLSANDVPVGGVTERSEKSEHQNSSQGAKELQEELLTGGHATRVDNRMHLELIRDFRDFFRLFYEAKWRFYICNKKREFITTSNPCVEIFPKLKRAFGPSFHERQHLFPLSPRVMCEAIAPWIPGKRVKRKVIPDEAVVAYNIQHANHSYVPGHLSRCYSSRKSEFEAINIFRKKLI